LRVDLLSGDKVLEAQAAGASLGVKPSRWHLLYYHQRGRRGERGYDKVEARYDAAQRYLVHGLLHD
jgi:hypothetical protein